MRTELIAFKLGLPNGFAVSTGYGQSRYITCAIRLRHSLRSWAYQHVDMDSRKEAL
ncbi:MAG TPA: hypothetical protein VJM32_02200 [Candidatus Saccharimonadales bacterium]|nr:hypothetical protein [Candidatus Saccharimonadales bacterium]